MHNSAEWMSRHLNWRLHEVRNSISCDIFKNKIYIMNVGYVTHYNKFV